MLKNGSSLSRKYPKKIISKFAVPVIVPSSGSFADNGALSGITALNTTYSDCYMYFPANAIFAGSIAGLYYVKMSSTTAGTVYQNTYSGGAAEIIANPTPWVCTGTGLYTQSLTEITLNTITIPANTMGADGVLQSQVLFGVFSSAGSKTLKTKFGGILVYQAGAVASSAAINALVTIANRNNVAKQIVTAPNVFAGVGNSGTAFSNLAVNTSVDVVFSVTATLAVATDWAMMEGLSIYAYQT